MIGSGDRSKGLQVICHLLNIYDDHRHTFVDTYDPDIPKQERLAKESFLLCHFLPDEESMDMGT